MFIVKVCRSLENAKVSYAVVGGYAVALHGAVRGTVDVDIVIAWTRENLQNAEKALNQIGLVSQLPLTAQSVFDSKDEYVEKRNLIAWHFYNPKNPLEQVDLIITYDLDSKKIETIKTSVGKINILSRSDLIEMKRKSGRPQDLEDVKALEKL